MQSRNENSWRSNWIPTEQVAKDRQLNTNILCNILHFNNVLIWQDVDTERLTNIQSDQKCSNHVIDDDYV